MRKWTDGRAEASCDHVSETALRGTALQSGNRVPPLQHSGGAFATPPVPARPTCAPHRPSRSPSSKLPLREREPRSRRRSRAALPHQGHRSGHALSRRAGASCSLAPLSDFDADRGRPQVSSGIGLGCRENDRLHPLKSCQVSSQEKGGVLVQTAVAERDPRGWALWSTLCCTGPAGAKAHAKKRPRSDPRAPFV